MVERTLLDWSDRYQIKAIAFDPYQMVASSQRLARERLPMQEYPQTSGNLTESSSNLYELVQARNLTVYLCDDIRLAVSRAIAVESSRGWRIAKEKQSHKIDVVVALAMACLAAVVAQRKPVARCVIGCIDGIGGGRVHWDDPKRVRIRSVKVPEQKAPASRGIV